MRPFRCYLSTRTRKARSRSSSRKVCIPISININLVSRVVARSEVMKIDVELDVNTDIYPMEEGAYYSMVLANSVNLDGTPDYDVLR